MDNLLMAERFASEYDELDSSGEQKYKSIFLSKCTFNPKTTTKNWEGTEKSMLYYSTTEGVFDVLRDMEEFVERQQRLSN